MSRWVVSAMMADCTADGAWRTRRLETLLVDAENRHEAIGFFLATTWDAYEDGKVPVVMNVQEIFE